MELFSKMIATALGVAVHQVNNTLSLLAGADTVKKPQEGWTKYRSVR